MDHPYRFQGRLVTVIVVGYPAPTQSSEDMMAAEEVHVAHPRLYGAPAYARPPLTVTPTARPLHPDDLPIAAEQTPQERAIAEGAVASAYGVPEAAAAAKPDSRGRSHPLRLGRLADKILRRAS